MAVGRKLVAQVKRNEIDGSLIHSAENKLLKSARI